MRMAEEGTFPWPCRAELMEHSTDSARVRTLSPTLTNVCRHAEALWTNIFTKC